MEQILVLAMRAGIRLQAIGDELRISAPQGALTQQIRDGLRQHKQAIIEYLRLQDQPIVETSLPKLQPDETNKQMPFPLSDIQHAYWLGRNKLIEFSDVSTHFYFELDCEQMDIERLTNAFNQLIARHDMLRAVIEKDGMQRILPEVPYYPIHISELASESLDIIEQAITAVRDELSHQVLPADQWPLFEIRATRMPAGRVRLHISLDFLIVDGWSVFLLFREWQQLYEDSNATLSPIRVSYRDYLLMEKSLIGSPSHTRARDYWMERIAELPGPPELPVRAITLRPDASQFSRRRAGLDKARWMKLKSRAGEEGLTVSCLLLAAYAEVIDRWSATSHFTLNMTLFNRLPLHEDVGMLVGDFTSLVLVEVDCRDRQSTFRERAVRLQRQLAASLDHREMSGIEVMREWSRRNDGALKATMPYVFTSGLVFGEGDDAGCLERFGPMVYGISQTPQVWIDHQIMEVNGELVFNWDALDGIFEEGVLDAMFASFRQLLERLADHKSWWHNCSVTELPVAVTSDRFEVNATHSGYRESLLHAGFVEQALEHPDSAAIIAPEVSLSYGELLTASVGVARRLKEGGLRPGELAAVLMHKGWEQIVAVMGILLAGGAYMPVDANLPSRRQIELLRIGEARHIVTQADLSLDFVEMEPDAYNILVVHPSTACCLSHPDADYARCLLAESEQGLDDLAYVIFTSGTTGVPKGVMISHRGAVNTIEHVNRLFSVSERDRTLAVSSLSFDLSVYDIFGLLAVGGAIVIPDHRKGHDPVHWRQLMDRYGVTLWNSAPQLMRMLMDSFYTEAEQAEAPLATVLLSGDWIPLDLPDRIRSRYRQTEVVSLGGATEASIWSIYYRIDEIDKSWSSIPYGKPLPNQTIWVYDDAMQVCPDYVKGRIFIGGIGVALGYWRDTERTSARFILHPATGERLYDTGDMGCYAGDGNVLFLGRDDNQLKIRGHRVELGEIASLLRQHPEVKEAVVIPAAGAEHNSQLVAYVELNGSDDGLSELGSVEWISEKEAAAARESLESLLNDIRDNSDARLLDASYEAAWSILDDYYVAALLVALRQYGIKGVASEIVSLDQLFTAGVAARYERWLHRAFHVLVEDGLAKMLRHGVIELIGMLPEPDLTKLTQDVQGKLCSEMGFDEEESKWFTDAAEQLHLILSERKHSAEMYTADATARIYQKLFPDSHEQLKRAVRQFIANKQEGGTIRVLEAGAGLGSATQHLLPLLNDVDCHYVFTDISEYFLQRASNLFSPICRSIAFNLFNLDTRPELQGFERNSFDLIIASSMLHDVEDVHKALEHLLSLLKPGGRLMLLEETRFFRSFDLHMGLQQGFDVFRDEQLRSRHCLLSASEWESALRHIGFADTAVSRSPGSVSDYLGFHVIIATAPNQVQRLDGRAVRRYLEERLPEYMVPRHIVHMERMPVSANGKIDYKALPIVTAQADTDVRERIAPRTALEQSILAAWSKVMGDREIGVTDNFFELGGDSLVATELLREMNTVMSFQLEMHEFFEHQTIEALAVLIENRQSQDVAEAAVGNELISKQTPYEKVAPVFSALQFRRDEIPLSDMQQGFFMADDPYMELHVRPHLYTEQDVQGLVVDRYEMAWNKVLERHADEIVVVREDGVLTAVRNPAPLTCSVYDLRHLSEEEVAGSLHAVRAEMQRSELPLDRWPWIDVRVSLWHELGVERARIHYNHNNFFWDGHAVSRLLHEVNGFYNNPNLVQPPLSLGFRDASIALNGLSNTEQGAVARRYWEERIPTLPGPPELPVIPGTNRRCRSMLNRRERIISAEVWQSFQQHARSYGITPSNAMFAVYAEILGAWSNSRHFIIGHMMTRRLNIHPEMTEIFGNFSSVYPLEIDLRHDVSFVNRARRIQEQVLRDAQHVHWGGMQVMQSLNRQQGGFGQSPVPFVVGSGLFMESFERPVFSCLETSQVMLDHQFWELKDGSLFYVLDIMEQFFPPGMVDDLWESYSGLIVQLAQNNSLWQQTVLSVIPERHLEERRLVQGPINAGSSERLEDGLRCSAASKPEAPALLSAAGALTYGNLAYASGHIAKELMDAGVRRGHTVAVAADRGPALLKAVYAVLKVGAAYVPLDPNLPEERRRYMLDNSEATVIVAEGRYANQLAWPDSVRVVTVDGLMEDSIAENETSNLVSTGNSQLTATQSTAGDAAYVIYTSGSTGQPKGVVIDHRGAVNTVRDINERFAVSEEDRVFGVSSFGFDLSVYDLFGASAAGAALVYPDPDSALNPSHWLDVMLAQQVTIWNSAPPLAVLLAEAAEYRDLKLPALRLVLLSGDWIPVDLPDRIRRIAQNARVVSLGGATEASIWSILYEIGQVDSTWTSIPYGYPMKNQSWFVLDEWGRPAPEWTAGELYIGGIGLAQGYCNDADKTAASFVHHSETGERLYRTGDRGRYVPGGVMEFLGRQDAQVKIQGHRIELGEIEAVLAACPNVSGSVIAVRKEAGANAASQLEAYVVLEEGTAFEPDALRQVLKQKLPDYMVPTRYGVLDRIPLSANGKVDRKALPGLAEPTLGDRAGVRIQEPRNETEAVLLGLWSSVLGTSNIAVNDDFFDLGGQSFEAVRLVGFISNRFGTGLSLGDIWEYRTVEKQAERLAQGERRDVLRTLVEIDSSGEGNPIYLVHPAGGHVMCYGELGKRLSRPVLAFQAPGADGREEPLDSIVKLARTYVEELVQRQPEGSVLLGGWSSGGLIAYEMAVQLRARERTVEGVVIIDSPAPFVHDPISDELLFQWFLGDLNLEPELYGELCDELCAMEQSGRTEREQLAAVAERTKKVLGADREQLYAIYRVFVGIVRGSRAYRAAPLDADLLVIRAREGIVGEFADHPYTVDTDWGWRRLATGQVETVEMDGTHYTLLASTSVNAAAAYMNHWIEKSGAMSIK